MKFIVYKVTNIMNGKIYIGQTTESLNRRWKRHCGYQLNDGTYFHKAIKKYGKDWFKIEVIDTAKNQDELDEKEFYWMTFYQSNLYGYNTSSNFGKSGGNTWDSLSAERKAEVSDKLSKTKLGSLNPNSTKVKAINIRSGSKLKFDSLIECQKVLNIPRHDIISRRCRKLILKPYNGEWMFEYL